MDGRDVYILDFSYERDELLEQSTLAKSITVLDHHATAAEHLAGLSDEMLGLHVEFDMERSGAMMAWDFFDGEECTEAMVKYVQDRDLWKWELPHSKEVSAYVKTLPYEIDAWEENFLNLDFDDRLPRVVEAGAAVLRLQDKIVEQQLTFVEYVDVLDYKGIPLCPCPRAINSEVAGRLAEDHPFAIVYYHMDGEKVWSLRSRGEHGADVSKIAQQLDPKGGGHKNAAGCRAPF